MTQQRTQSPIERAIQHALNMVEAARIDIDNGSAPFLTAAVRSLMVAFTSVADWTDKQAPAVAMADKDASPGAVTNELVEACRPIIGASSAIVRSIDNLSSRVDFPEVFLPTSVVKVVPRTTKRNESVIACLEKILVDARNENVTGIGIAMVDAEGYSRTNFEGGENLSTLIGAVCRLQKRLLDHVTDN